VGQEALPFVRIRRELSGSENNVVSNCESLRAHGSGRFSGSGIGMNTNTAQIATEARFHQRACSRFEWLTARAQLLVNYWRNFAVSGMTGTLALQALF
jgi:hypothetical protein